MAPSPDIKHVLVEAEWDGDPTHPLDLTVSMEVIARHGTQLNLIEQDHYLVQSTSSIVIERISFLTSRDEASALEQLPWPSIDEEHPSSPPMLRITKETSQTLLSPSTKALFAQTVSLYEDTGSCHALSLSPSLLPTASLSMRKRLSKDLDLHSISNKSSQASPGGRSSPSKKPHSLRKHPVPLHERPPWRPGGEQADTKGRISPTRNQAHRRISRSAGPVRDFGQRRQRRSSLPGHMKDAAHAAHAAQFTDGGEGLDVCVDPDLRAAARFPVLTPKNHATEEMMGETGLMAAKRLNEWLQGHHQQGSSKKFSHQSKPSAANEFSLDSALEEPAPRLFPSPTPSSCADLPWTSTLKPETSPQKFEQASQDRSQRLSSTIVLDNGIRSVLFGGNPRNNIFNVRFLVKFKACLRLEPQEDGSYRLTIPGLQTQAGEQEGSVRLIVEDKGKPNMSSGFQAFEKIAIVDDQMNAYPLQEPTLTIPFPLDEPLNIHLIRWQQCVNLAADDFELDSDAQAEYVWEVSDERWLGVKNSIICRLRLRQSFFWATQVRFTVFLSGGPYGKLTKELQSMSRLIDLDEERPDASGGLFDCLEAAILCPAVDIGESFTLTWKEVYDDSIRWRPQISNRRRKNILEEDKGRAVDQGHAFDMGWKDEDSPVCKTLSTEPFTNPGSRQFSSSESQKEEKGFKSDDAPVYQTVDRAKAFVTQLDHLSVLPGSDKENVRETEGSSGSVCRRHTVDLASVKLDSVEKETTEETLPKQLDQALTKNVLVKFAPRQIQPVADVSHGVKRGHNVNDPKALGGALCQSRNASAEFPPNKRLKSTDSMNEKIDVPRESRKALSNGKPVVTKRHRSSPYKDLYWYGELLLAPMRLLNVVFLTWIFLRAFGPEIVRPYENAVAARALKVLERWDFEPVQIHGDATGWRHLITALTGWDREKFRIERAKRLDKLEIVLGRSDMDKKAAGEGDSLEKPQVDRSRQPSQPVCAVESQWLMTGQKTCQEGGEEKVSAQEDSKTDKPISSDDSTQRKKHYVPPEEWYWYLLDRFDMALGWQPPLQ